VTETMTTLARSPRSNRAGQTRLPTFSISTTARGGGSRRSRPRASMAASRWQPVPVLIWTTGPPAAWMRPAAPAGGLAPPDDVKGHLAPQVAEGALQEGGLAGPRRADQVQGQDAAAGEPPPVALRQAVVAGEDFLLQAQRPPVRVAVGVPVAVAVVVGVRV